MWFDPFAQHFMLTAATLTTMETRPNKHPRQPMDAVQPRRAVRRERAARTRRSAR